MYGSSWDGWSYVLPDKSAESIRERANLLGIRVRRDQEKIVLTGAFDYRWNDVMRLFRNGFPPSAIDRKLGMDSGTARKMVCERWLLDKMAGRIRYETLAATS